MAEVEVIIESDSDISEMLKTHVKGDDLEIVTTKQKNMDGGLPLNLLYFVTTLDVVLKLLDLFLKSDEVKRKIKSLTIDEKKISELNAKEIKQIIELYTKKRRK